MLRQYRIDDLELERARFLSRSRHLHAEENEDAEEYVSFMGLPWHDEKGPDGQDYRLSQMLADEEWASDTESEEAEPMTLEDYNEQVKEITEKLEEELRETEEHRQEH